MNSLYTLCKRQVTLLQSDLALLETSLPSAGPGLHGQIAASLSALNRTIDDYDNMAKREIVLASKDKAVAYVSSFPLCLTVGGIGEIRNKLS